MFSINAENIAFLCYSGERICSISKSESITARCDPTCSEASCSLNATKVQYLDLSYTNTFLTAVLHIMEFLSCFDTSATDWSALGALLCGTFGGLLLLLSHPRVVVHLLLKLLLEFLVLLTAILNWGSSTSPPSSPVVAAPCSPTKRC